MTQPPPALGTAPDAVALVQALKADAARLGLVWIMAVATVDSYDATTGKAQARLDHDAVPISMVSMVGALIADQRVYVLRIPPSGNFIVGLVDSDWITPTLLNSWVNFGAGFQGARFRRLSTGQVEVQGLVKNGTGPSSVVFTLPTGYRPTGHMIFASIANSVVARIDVETDGDVVWQAGGTNAFLSLNLIFHTG